MTAQAAGRAAALPIAVSRSGFLLLLLAYVVLQAALRVASSPSLGRDDLIEAIIVQGWALGYNPTQPPLYAWLVMAATSVLGQGILAHVVVKFACLYLGYVFYYLAAERALGDPYHAALATLTWLLTYMFGWDITQNYTESVLLMTMTAATMYVVLRMRDAEDKGGASWKHHAALGAAVGLGMLTKYSFPAFAGTLLAAGLLDAKLRRALLNPRLFIAIWVALLVFAPHGLWFKYGPHNFRGAFTGALQVGWRGGYLSGVAAGLTSMLRSSFDFLAPGVLLWPLLFGRALLPRVPAATPDALATRRLFDRWLLISYGGMAVTVLAAGATVIKYHYMVAALSPAPIWLFLRVRDLRLPAWRGHALMALAALSVVLVTGAVAWRGFVVTDRCGRCYLQWDYAGVADKLRAAGFKGGTIMADDHHIGGNLRTHFPDTPMYTMKFPDFVPPLKSRGDGQCLAIWDAAEEGDALPEDIAEFLKIRLGANIDGTPPARVIEQNFRRSDKRKIRLGYVLFPQGTGQCR